MSEPNNPSDSASQQPVQITVTTEVKQDTRNPETKTEGQTQHPHEEEKKQNLRLEIKDMMQRGLIQCLKGCGRKLCFFPQCKANPEFELPGDKKQIILYVKKQVQEQNIIVCPKAINEAVPFHFQNLPDLESNTEETVTQIKVLFENYETLGMSFNNHPGTAWEASQQLLKSDKLNVDVNAVVKFYTFLSKTDNLQVEVIQLVERAITSLGQALKAKDALNLEVAIHYRCALILLLCPDIYEPQQRNILTHLLGIVYGFRLIETEERNEQLIDLMQSLPRPQFKQIVDGLQVCINIDLMSHATRLPLEAIEMLDVMYTANQEVNYLKLSEFYNDSVSNILHHHLEQQYRVWMRNKVSTSTHKPFCIIDYPWVINPPQKSLIILIESQHEMKKSIRSDNFFEGIQGLHGLTFPYFYMEIRRDFIIEDALNMLTKTDANNLKKPLKIKFQHEQGIDEGGPQKEFFQLLVKQLFTPEYSMFHYYENSRLFWINANSFEPNIKFELIGILLGEAIFNGIILDIKFPSAIYKKLMNVEVDLEDLREIKPDVVENLEKMIEYKEDDFEDVFCINFTVQEEVWGEIKTYELKPGGEGIPVAQNNKEEYVELYVDHFLNKQIEAQFKSFYKGFHRVIGGEAIKLLHPKELELLICGNPTFDFKDLERGCKYDGGYHEKDVIIQWFWDIFHNNFTQEERKQFLAFSTGSDRSPVGGLSELNFIIGKNGPDSDRLPTAHTCFNYLLLPKYSSKEKLEKLLRLAIQNSEGFGLM